MAKDFHRAGRHAAGEKAAGGLSLIAVQSIACAALLLVSLLVRLAGGSGYDQLRSAFHQAVEDDTAMKAVAALFDTGKTTLTTTAPTTASSSAASTTTTSAAATSAPTGGDPQPVKVAQTAAVAPPDGSTYQRLQTSLVARLPVDRGVLTSGYGWRENPTGAGNQFHAGVDIAADKGAPIYAMYFGVVIDAGDSPSYGKYVRLYHGDGIEVLYAHCSAVTAKIGDAVNQGEKVALVGATGDATGNHVHIEVFREDTRYDPTGVVPVGAYV
ncbi:MAG: M23 family metallopeptidase [Acutalibacteraceae bacterium]|jgi:murein DD-endopeptidase MepM/ murein hydrolase activator NlpD